jgi:RNA polymerase sigma-70 factor (ECF subfamily)
MTAAELKQIMIKYQRPLLSVIQKMVHSHEIARDMLQEVYIRYWKSAQKGKITTPAFSLLYRIAMNLSIDHLRREKISPFSNSDTDHDPGYVPGESNELYQIILKCAAQLKPRQKAAFILRDMEGLNFQEISQILDISVENIRSNLCLARKNIKNMLEVHYDITQEFFYEL